jgi:hypothetical protein
MMKKALILLVAFLAWPCLAAPVASGDYEGFLIGVDRNGALTGYFESSTGNGQFSCVFFVSGKAGGLANKVNTWLPGNRDSNEVIYGVLEQLSSSGKPAIRLKLEVEHGGCWNVQHFASDQSTFTLTEQGNWESIQIVASKKAYFYDDPSSPKPRKAYVVTGNVLRVFETREGWVRADYVGPDKRHTHGWITQRDLFSATSPESVE